MSGAGRRLQLAKCIDIVRKQDPNHYLCSTLLSPKYRATSFILHALNCELDQIVNKTTKAHLAALKFKWWTDAVNKVCNDADKVPPHPVASSLPDIVKDSRTCKYFLTKLVKGKLERAENPLRIAKTMETVEDHFETTYSSLFYLILESSGVDDTDCLQAASHMGKGVGLTLLLKSIPRDALNDKVYLPTDLCLKSKVNYNKVTKGYNSDGLTDVVFQVASKAKIHLDEVRQRHTSLPSHLKPFLLPCIPPLKYLERLERANFAPFTPDLEDDALTDLGLKARLAWSSFIGKI